MEIYRELLYTLFKRWRFLVWENVSFRHIVSSIKSVKLGERKRWYDLHASLPVDTKTLYTEFNTVISNMLSFNADIIVGYPSKITELCSILSTKPNHKLSFRYCSTAGETLTEAQRTFIKKTLSCEVYDRYGTEEFRVIGVECKKHHGFHLNSESFILEVVDSKGKKVLNGESGRIIITDLENHIMPFIRYDIGDWGEILTEKCLCGLNTPRFIIEGRSSSLEFEGKVISYVDINFLMTKHVGAILQWQLRKKSKKELKVILVRGSLFDSQITSTLEEKFKNILGGGIDVQFDLREPMERISERKCKLFIDDTKNKEALS